MEKSIDWNGIKLTGSVDLTTDYKFIELEATENKTYKASDYNADGFSQVSVNVPIPEYISVPLVIDQNGVYKASDYEADGFSQVTTNINTSFLNGTKSVLLNKYEIFEVLT